MTGAITVISSEGELVESVPMPDVYTTNICFGGADLQTAYVTLSGSDSWCGCHGGDRG